jgi:hypothetical protein
MRRAGWAYAAFLALGAAAAARQGDNNEALRKTLKDVDLVGKWVYDDLAAGYAEAKKTGKPMLVVFR